MKLFSGIFDRAEPPQRIEPNLTASSDAGEQSGVWRPEQWLVNSFGSASKSGAYVNHDRALTLPAVMQAVRILTGVFAVTPVIYYGRGEGEDKNRATDNPLYILFHDKPNGYQGAFAFKELILKDLLFWGNFYGYVIRDRYEVPLQIIRLDPAATAMMQYFDEQDGFTFFYDVSLPNGRRTRLTNREVWHVRGMSDNGVIGLNPIRYMRETVGASLALVDHASKFFANDAKPSVMLTSPQRITAEQKELMRQSWQRIHAGSDNAHSVAIADQDLKPLFLAHDNEKSQFNETRIFQVIDVARAFGVPPHLLFELSKATFSNIEQQSLEFITYHMMPHYERVAGAANFAFAEPNHFFEFMPDALLKGDFAGRWAGYNIARNLGVFNANEIRAKENMNKIPGEAGEEYWKPANIGMPGTPQTQPQDVKKG